MSFYLDVEEIKTSNDPAVNVPDTNTSINENASSLPQSQPKESIQKSGTQKPDEEKGNSELEISKISSTSTITSTSSKDDSDDEMPNLKEQENFEKNFNKYYMDSSKNTEGNFDGYVKKALKLISLIPTKSLEKSTKKTVKKINKEISDRLAEIKKQNPNKKLLVLDLDETLVHSDIDFQLDQIKTHYDTMLSFNSDDQKDICLPLILRPGLYDFLNYAKENFVLAVFTASCSDYADAILNYIEKDTKYFSLRLYRNHCIFVNPGLYVKDLRIFNGIYKKNEILIIDNSLYAFANQLNNGILITSFFDDIDDIFLYNIMYYLDMIKNEEDVRKMNKENFLFEDIKNDIIVNDL